MTLIESMLSSKIRFYARTRDDQDFTTIHDIKLIRENVSFFKIFYKEFPLTHIFDFNDYCNYVISKKIVDLEKYISSLDSSDDLSLISDLIKEAKRAIEPIGNGDIISFINNSYKDILQKDYYEFGICDLFYATIDFIVQFKTGIKEHVFEYICDNFSYIIVHNYDELERIIELNPNLFKKTFSSKNIDELEKSNLTSMLDIFKYILNKEKSNLTNEVETVVQILSNNFELLANNTSQENVMRNEGHIRAFYEFLKSIKHVNANKFEKFYNKVNDVLKEYINTSGHVISSKIDISPMVNIINSELPIAAKIMHLSHFYQNNSKRWEAFLNEAPMESHPILDLVSTNVPTNSYFTFTHQMALDEIIKIGALSLRWLFSNSNFLAEFCVGYGEVLDSIFKEIDEGGNELIADFELLSNMISSIFSLNKSDEKTIVQSHCYGAAMFTCAFIEKLLRYVYTYVYKSERFIPLNKATLGELLADREEGLVDVLGEYQIKHLRFYLCGEKNSDVGYSYRNKLAHLNQVKLDSLTPLFVCELFYLLTSVMNSIFLYLVDDDNSE